MHCSFLNLFSTPNPNVLKEGTMHRSSYRLFLFIAFLLILITFPVGCGDWSNYQPSCNTPDGCSQTGALPTDTDTTPPASSTYDCSGFAAEAAQACIAAGGSLLYSECDPTTGANTVLCDTDGDGQSDVIVNITINDDGDVTVEEGDANYSGDSEGDADTDTDADSDADSDSDTDTDTDTDCEVTAGGVEYCDGVDNDCNGITDDGDFDGDGWISDDCTAYDGTSTQTGDCQDGGGYVGSMHSALIHPGRSFELFNWLDENCNSYNEQGLTEAVVEYDGCALICNSDSSNPTTEYFETDGDAELECISAAVIADQSSDEDALDTTVSFVYGGTTYSGVAVTCDDSSSVQGNPASWDDIDDVKTAICADTPALTTAECLALF